MYSKPARSAGFGIPSTGFIAVVLAIRKEGIKEYVPLMDTAVQTGMRGYIIAGEKDRFLDATVDLHKEFVLR